MAFQPGYKSVFYLGGTNNTLVNLQPYIDTVSVPQTVSMLETSVLGTVSKAFITGLTDGDVVSLSGPYDPVTYNQLTALKAQQTAGGSNATPYVYGPGGSVVGQARSAGSILVQTVSTSTGVGGRVEFSASLQITGAVTNSTF